MIFSGGAPYSLVDGDSVTIWDNNESVTLQLTSGVKGMHIIDSSLTDMDSGIVGISSDADTTSTSEKIVFGLNYLVIVRKILILLLEQEILFIDLSSPE